MGDKVVTRPGPDRAVVFQAFALFPWKSVEDNIGFGLKCKGMAAPERAKIIKRFIELMGLGGYEKAYPHQLSGGMQQRVAIALQHAADVLEDLGLVEGDLGHENEMRRVGARGGTIIPHIHP